MKSTYDAVYERWLDEPEDFWAEAAEAVQWYKKWDRVLDASQAPLYRWFAGGVLNSCYNALDVHIERGRADQPALDEVARALPESSSVKGFRKETALLSTCQWCRRPP